MIATDASGQGSVLHGKTRDHVLALNAVLLDGTLWHSRPLEPAQLEPAQLHLARTRPRPLPTWQGRKGPAESSSYSTYAIT